MPPESLQSNPNVWDFYTKYAIFQLFNFRQEEIIGAHDVNVISFVNDEK